MPRRTQSSESRQRFVRAVNTRVNNALLELAKIGKLASDRYEYSQDDIEQIMKSLEDELGRIRDRLERRPRTADRVTIIAE